MTIFGQIEKSLILVLNNLINSGNNLPLHIIYVGINSNCFKYFIASGIFSKHDNFIELIFLISTLYSLFSSLLTLPSIRINSLFPIF